MKKPPRERGVRAVRLSELRRAGASGGAGGRRLVDLDHRGTDLGPGCVADGQQ